MCTKANSRTTKGTAQESACSRVEGYTGVSLETICQMGRASCIQDQTRSLNADLRKGRSQMAGLRYNSRIRATTRAIIATIVGTAKEYATTLTVSSTKEPGHQTRGLVEAR